MIDPKLFDDLAKRLSDAVPTGLKDVRDEMEKNFRSILQSAFAKMDLVTREEFDVQAGVLARTRKQLDDMEKRLKSLETDKPSAKKATSKSKATSKKDKK